MALEPLLRAIDVLRAERQPLPVTFNPGAEATFADVPAERVPGGGAGERSDAARYDHQSDPKVAFGREISRERKDQLGGDRRKEILQQGEERNAG